MLIDSHCHLNYLAKNDLDVVASFVRDAEKVGVSHLLCIGVDIAALPEVLQIGETFPKVKVTAGVHPCDVASMPLEPALAALEQAMSHPEVVAVGECGLDYYREEGLDKSLQHDYFSAQIELALRHEKPLIVHTRAARDDTIAYLKNHGKGRARGVLHCFTETLSMAKAALDLGVYLSFSGVITFKNAESIRDVVRYAPLDRILVETDSPYLAPVPFRGKTNQPAYVVEVAKKVAEIKQKPFALVCETTFKNTQDLFGWPL